MVLKFYESPFHATESFEDANKSVLKADIVIMLREIIERQNWTQTEAMEKLGVNQSCLVDILSGQINNFNLDTLFSILYKLGFGAEITFGNLEEASINIKKLPIAA